MADGADILVKKGVTETRYPSSLNFAHSRNHGRKRQHGNARECIHVPAMSALALAEEPLERLLQDFVYRTAWVSGLLISMVGSAKA